MRNWIRLKLKSEIAFDITFPTWQACERELTCENLHQAYTYVGSEGEKCVSYLGYHYLQLGVRLDGNQKLFTKIPRKLPLRLKI